MGERARQVGFMRAAGALLLTAAGVASCAWPASSGSGAAAQANPPSGASSPGLVLPIETYRRGIERVASSAMLFLPGLGSQQRISFDVVGGMAVMEGDIVLGKVTDLPSRFGLPRIDRPNRHSAVASTESTHLWPRGDVPFEIAPNVNPVKIGWIRWAVAHVSETEVKLRPRTANDSDYVHFIETQDSCHSMLGRVGGAQEIEVGGCTVQGSVAHEILHALGVYHEQSRGDRDDFVSIQWDEISPNARGQFEKRSGSAQDIGTYDYGSIMHYGRTSFSKAGKPTIVPKDPSAPIGQRAQLSARDRAAIRVMYAGGVPGAATGVPAGWPSIPGLPFPPAGSPLPGSQPGGSPLPIPIPSGLPGLPIPGFGR